MNWIKRPLKLEIAFSASYSIEFVGENAPAIGSGWISLHKPVEYEDFKNTTLYKLFLRDNKKQEKGLLQKSNLKIVGFKYLEAGYRADDFSCNMFSVVSKWYAVRVPRFAKNYLLNKTKRYANNARTMQRKNLVRRRSNDKRPGKIRT